MIRHSVGPRGVVLLPANGVGIASFNVTHFSHARAEALARGTVNSIRCVSPRRTGNRFASRHTSVCSINIILCRVLANDIPFSTSDTISITLVRLRGRPGGVARVGPGVPLNVRRVYFRTVRGGPRSQCRATARVLLSLRSIVEGPGTAFSCACFISGGPAGCIFGRRGLGDTRTSTSRVTSRGSGMSPGRGGGIVATITINVIFLVTTVMNLILFVARNIGARDRGLRGFINRSCSTLISGAGCGCGFITRCRGASRCSPNVIVSRSPGTNRHMVSNSAMALGITTDTRSVSIPGYCGLALSGTRGLLRRDGLAGFGIARVSGRGITSNSIVCASPGTGSIMSTSGRVVVCISSNPSAAGLRACSIPSLSNLARDSTGTFLRGSNFGGISIRARRSAIHGNIILSRSPGTNEATARGRAVGVCISSKIAAARSAANNRFATAVGIGLPSCSNSPGSAVIIDMGNDGCASRTIGLSKSAIGLTIPTSTNDEVRLIIRLARIDRGCDNTCAVGSSGAVGISFSEDRDRWEGEGGHWEGQQFLLYKGHQYNL